MTIISYARQGRNTSENRNEIVGLTVIMNYEMVGPFYSHELHELFRGFSKLRVAL